MQWGTENIMTIDLGNHLLFLKRKHRSLDIVVCFGWSSINWGAQKHCCWNRLKSKRSEKLPPYCNKCCTMGNCTLVSFKGHFWETIFLSDIYVLCSNKIDDVVLSMFSPVRNVWFPNMAIICQKLLSLSLIWPELEQWSLEFCPDHCSPPLSMYIK